MSDTGEVGETAKVDDSTVSRTLPSLPSVRSRQPTEKGMSYQKELLRSSRNSLCSKIKHQMSAIDLLKEQGGSLEIITSEMENFDSKFDELLEINRRYQQLLTKDEENVDGNWIEDLDREVFHFKDSLKRWRINVDDDHDKFHLFENTE